MKRKKNEKPSRIERKKTEMSVNVQRMSVRKSGDFNDLGKIKYFNGEFFLHRNILHNARFIRFSHLTCLPTNFNIPPRARDSYIKNNKKTKTASFHTEYPLEQITSNEKHTHTGDRAYTGEKGHATETTKTTLNFEHPFENS